MAPPVHRAPQPTRTCFDPYHSTTVGHQVYAHILSGSVSWRESRTHKLGLQLRDTSGGGGKGHVPDLLGAVGESLEAEEMRRRRNRNQAVKYTVLGEREKGCQDIRDLMSGVKKKIPVSVACGKYDHEEDKENRVKKTQTTIEEVDDRTTTSPSTPASLLILSSVGKPSIPSISVAAAATTTPSEPETPQIFRSLTLYVNASTVMEGISDHKLKNIFVQHGGHIAIAFGRRTVTHVVLSDCSSAATSSFSSSSSSSKHRIGGGLAAGKMQKEITRVGGKGIKFVTAKWIVDSVKSGKRLPESRYQPVKVAMKGQGRVLPENVRRKREEEEEIIGDS